MAGGIAADCTAGGGTAATVSPRVEAAGVDWALAEGVAGAGEAGAGPEPGGGHCAQPQAETESSATIAKIRLIPPAP